MEMLSFIVSTRMATRAWTRDGSYFARSSSALFRSARITPMALSISAIEFARSTIAQDRPQVVATNRSTAKILLGLIEPPAWGTVGAPRRQPLQRSATYHARRPAAKFSRD